ncbi:MAG: hypothetical protein EPO27_09860 [Betaproteobacteria bacterium]|nr:MAG: hypothetical protein EPO27_09860 [Betaproteobacteria bacterium]
MPLPVSGIAREPMPTRRVQFAGCKRADGSKPFQLDACHALATTGETVRRLYPKWYVGKNKVDA